MRLNHIQLMQVRKVIAMICLNRAKLYTLYLNMTLPILHKGIVKANKDSFYPVSEILLSFVNIA